MSKNPKPFLKTPTQVAAIKLMAKTTLHTMLYGGSRSGKTFIILYTIIYRALLAPGSRHLVLRKHFTAVKQSVVLDTLPKVMAICFPGVQYHVNKSDWFLRLWNGSEIWFGGLDNQERADKILGKEYATIYFNEASEFTYESIEVAHSRLAQNCPEITNRFFYDCNPTNKRHWTYVIFKEGLHPTTREGINKELYCDIQLNPKGNEKNLPKGYIENILANLSRRQRIRFLAGEFADDAEGALWKRAWIDDYRVKDDKHLPQDKRRKYARILVGVDPAVTNKATSDGTGIIVGAKGVNGEYYVLEDRTIHGSVAEWAKEVASAYARWGADAVVAETNQGGDLVVSNIHNENKNIRVIKVTATRGKAIRAEPITGLSERGLIHFVGEHFELENNLCTWNPITDAADSPDRLDAFVWLMTELSGGADPESSGGAFKNIGPW